MKGIPPELLYALVFAGIIVVQILKRLSAAKAEQRKQVALQAGQQVDEQEQAVDNFLDFGRLEQPAPIAWEPPPVTVESVRPALIAKVSQVRARRARRRFSRQALFGNRRDVQNAIVIAAILGPCRGMDPPGAIAKPDAT